ncbi:MAG: 3-oxoacyl-[acyl-carrier-protein] reductase [Desulfobacterales bacterium]|nr:3-oxoacyl-[acyl-carrier-protein] reductase [Desulfobacterales bacterium]
MRFENKVVMVTGGAAGIGLVTAQSFAKEGAKVAICDVNVEAGEAAAKALGPEASFARVDVANSASVSDWVDAVMQQKGQIDVLVNNAGITRDGLIMRMKEEDWDAVIAVNLKSAFNCIKAVSKIMVKQRTGRIINLASVVGVMGNPGQANYVASKAGMIGLTKTVAKELGPRGVTVNAVAPGFIETDMTAVLSDKARQAMLGIIPLQRAGTPQDVAEAITFLASDSAAYITGQVLHVTGGMYM